MSSASFAKLTAAHLTRRANVATLLAARSSSPPLTEKETGVPSGIGPGIRGNGSTKYSPRNKGNRVRLSVRIDDERHLRLKLTAAHLRLHVQDVLVAALDKYLEHASPEILNKNCCCLKATSAR
jgi:hypothetical protein